MGTPKSIPTPPPEQDVVPPGRLWVGTWTPMGPDLVLGGGGLAALGENFHLPRDRGRYRHGQSPLHARPRAPPRCPRAPRRCPQPHACASAPAGKVVYAETTTAHATLTGLHYYHQDWFHAAAYVTVPPLRLDTNTSAYLMSLLAK